MRPHHQALVLLAVTVAAGCNGGGGGGGGGKVDAAARDAADGSSLAIDGPIEPRDDAGVDAADATMSSGIAACGDLDYTSTMRRVPATPTDQYLRCETRGPESGSHAILSPDGSRLAVITTAGTVRLFATAPWTEVAQLAAPIGRIDAIAVSPDGATLATLAAEMGLVTLWRTSDGERGASIAGPPASTINTWVSALAFSADGRRLATSLGTVIDLDTGATIATFQGGSTHRLAFAPAGGKLLIDHELQIGNSPTTRWLYLLDLATDAQTDLFKMYDRALTGYAVSADGGRVALAKTDEAQVGGAPAGLSIHRTDTGAEVVADPAFIGTVLAFSPDGARLFTRHGDSVTVRDSGDLHAIAQFAWPAAARFLGVSPGGDLVAAVDGATSWWQPPAGTIRQTLPDALAQVVWSADGQYGVGAGAPGAMFSLWREAGATRLCTPPAAGGPAPTLASLGTTMDADGNATSADGSMALTTAFAIHTHATDYYAVHVYQTSNGETVRIFSPTSPPRAVAMSAPDAARLFTIEGGAVAAWCR